MRRVAEGIWFQSHLGLISFLVAQRTDHAHFKVSIPPWSDFFHSLRHNLLSVSRLFQSHLGLISFSSASSTIILSTKFQSHLGLISFASIPTRLRSSKMVSIPPWSDFFPSAARRRVRRSPWFQSLLGLISFMSAPCWVHKLINPVSIPPWSDFFLVPSKR